MKNVQTYTQGISGEQDAIVYAEKKLTPLEKFITKDPETISWELRLKRVESDTTAHVFSAEAVMYTSHKNYGAESEGESIYVAIDELKSELHKKIRRHKDKRLARFRDGARKIKSMLKRDTI